MQAQCKLVVGPVHSNSSHCTAFDGRPAMLQQILLHKLSPPKHQHVRMCFDFFAAETSEQDSVFSANSDDVSEYVSPIVNVSTTVI